VHIRDRIYLEGSNLEGSNLKMNKFWFYTCTYTWVDKRSERVQ
jgi:hypothetical protein